MIKDMLEPLVCERFLNDEKYRLGHIRVINALPGVEIMGLHAPEIKGVARELAAREDALEIVAGFCREANDDGQDGGRVSGNDGLQGQPLCYEEKLIWGLMLNAIKLPVEERFGLLRKFVPHIDNWAVCDSFCCSAKWVVRPKASNPARPEEGAESPVRKTLPFWKCSQEELWNFLEPYFASGHEFEVRFAVIMAMCNLMDEAWLPKIFAKFDTLDFGRIESEYISIKQYRQMEVSAGGIPASGQAGRGMIPGTDNPQKGVVIGEPPYYVRMGVAWFLATALAKFPEETRRFVSVSRLPEDVIRLYVRKARESFRTRDISPF